MAAVAALGGPPTTLAALLSVSKRVRRMASADRLWRPHCLRFQFGVPCQPLAQSGPAAVGRRSASTHFAARMGCRVAIRLALRNLAGGGGGPLQTVGPPLPMAVVLEFERVLDITLPADAVELFRCLETEQAAGNVGDVQRFPRLSQAWPGSGGGRAAGAGLAIMAGLRCFRVKTLQQLEAELTEEDVSVFKVENQLWGEAEDADTGVDLGGGGGTRSAGLVLALTEPDGHHVYLLKVWDGALHRGHGVAAAAGLAASADADAAARREAQRPLSSDVWLRSGVVDHRPEPPAAGGRGLSRAPAHGPLLAFLRGFVPERGLGSVG
eukprot:SAG22_NODE_1503_length_4277_cov_18.029440_5_plen_324_part_00